MILYHNPFLGASGPEHALTGTYLLYNLSCHHEVGGSFKRFPDRRVGIISVPVEKNSAVVLVGTLLVQEQEEANLCIVWLTWAAVKDKIFAEDENLSS